MITENESKKRDIEYIYVNGQIKVEESKIPVPNLVVNVYFINLTALKGNSIDWRNKINRKSIIKKIGDDITDLNGFFSVVVPPEIIAKGTPSYGLIVFPAKSQNNRNILYASPTPKVLLKSTNSAIHIPENELKNSNQLPEKPIENVEIKMEKTSDSEAGKDTIVKNREKNIEKNKEISVIVKKAFKNYRPTSLNKTMISKENYLENKEELPNLIKKVQKKAINNLLNSGIGKKRQIKLSHNMIKELGIEKNKKIKLSQKQLEKVLGKNNIMSIAKKKLSLRKIEKNKHIEQAIMNSLFGDFKKRKYKKGEIVEK